MAVVAVALFGLALRLLADDEADVDARHGARPSSLLSLRSCLFGDALMPPLCVDCVSVIHTATAIMDALLSAKALAVASFFIARDTDHVLQSSLSP